MSRVRSGQSVQPDVDDKGAHAVLLETQMGTAEVYANAGHKCASEDVTPITLDVTFAEHQKS